MRLPKGAVALAAVALAAAVALLLWAALWTKASRTVVPVVTTLREPAARDLAAPAASAPTSRPEPELVRTALALAPKWTTEVTVVDADDRPVRAADVDVHDFAATALADSAWCPDGSRCAGAAAESIVVAPTCSVRTDALGHASIACEHRRICLRAVRLGFGASPGVVVDRPVHPPLRVQLTLRLNGERVVRGFVRDLAGRGLADARVTARIQPQDELDDPLFAPRAGAVSDEKGEFAIVIPGDHKLEITASWNGLGGDTFELAREDDPPAIVTLRVPVAGVVEGRVLDSDGRPSPATFVEFWDRRREEDDRTAAFASLGPCWTDAEGRFKIAVHTAGSYRAFATRIDGASSGIVDVAIPDQRSALTRDLHLLPSSTLAGTAADDQGAPLAGVTILAWTAASPRRAQARTGARGEFMFTDLVQGLEYTLAVQVAPRLTIPAGTATSPAVAHAIVVPRTKLATAALTVHVERATTPSTGPVTIVLRRDGCEPEHHELRSTQSALRLVALPAAMPLTLEVHALGNESWNLEDLVLAAGESRELHVRLSKAPR